MDTGTTGGFVAAGESLEDCKENLPKKHPLTLSHYKKKGL